VGRPNLTRYWELNRPGFVRTFPVGKDDSMPFKHDENTKAKTEPQRRGR
jgi:hypothetical protein